jgi:hypothetical protein
MPTPSLILVPARFKTGKLYTPLATTSGGVVLGASGDFNVTRATTATRVNASGLIESVASGVPRLDYYTSGGTAGCPALLVEAAATNFADAVQYLSRAEVPAASGGLTITTGSTDFLAPDGTSGSITKYVGGAASGVSQYALYTIGNDIAVTASGVHTLSMFVKVGATNPLNFVGLSYNGFTAASGTLLSYFNLASGTALTSGASIQNYGNGWYRLILPPLTIASGDLVGSVILYFAQGNGNANWSASGALNLTAYAWGLQMEAGSVATSYIPTNTAAVTRNADVINLSGAVSGCVGQTEGTMYLDFIFRRPTIATAGPCGIASSNNQNRVLFWNNNSTNSMAVNIQVNAANIFNISVGTLIEGTRYKLAIGYKSGNSAIFLNGIQVGSTNTSAFTFAASLVAIFLGTYEAAAASVTNTGINAFTLYTTRLTNTELAALTA